MSDNNFKINKAPGWGLILNDVIYNNDIYLYNWIKLIWLYAIKYINISFNKFVKNFKLN